MNFLRVGGLFALSTLSKLLAGLVVVKVIAIAIGVGGLGRLGQFMSLMSMMTVIAGGGITNGVVKYVAEAKNDVKAVDKLIGVASFVTVFSSLALCVLLYFNAEIISKILFQDISYSHVVKVLSFCQVFIAVNNLLLGLVNAYQRVKAFAIVNASGSFLGAIGVAYGCFKYGFEGAMYGLIWMPSCQIIFLCFWYGLGSKFSWEKLFPIWDLSLIRNYLKFSLMLLVTVATMQSSQIVVRYIIEKHANWDSVGYWQASMKISDAYLQFIVVILGNYYLPRLAALREKKEVVTEVIQAFKIAMPILFVMIVCIFFFKKEIILLLFSEKFSEVQNFLPIQLIGDFFKIAAYLIGYVAVAKANVRLYIAAEVFQACCIVGLTFVLAKLFGAIGATYAYVLVYIAYFFIAAIAFRVYAIRPA